MKYVKNLFIGGFLAIMGLVMFLQKLTFNDPSNKGIFGDIFGAIFGNTSPKAVSGIMVVVILIMLLIFAFSPNFLTFGGLVLSILVMAFVIIASMNITVAQMSGLEVGVIMVMLVGGIGIAGRSALMLIGPNGKHSKSNI